MLFGLFDGVLQTFCEVHLDGLFSHSLVYRTVCAS